MTARTRSGFAKAAALATGAALLAAGCAKNAPQTSLEPQGPKAQSIHNLVVPVFSIAGVVMVLILGGALFVAWKFRAKSQEDYDEFPDQVHGHFAAEIGWTIAPAILMAVVGIFTVATVFDLAREPKEEALHIEVYGQQWWWEYRYLDDEGNVEFVTANDMVIPAGREIALQIRSRDVIHSWWAPALNGKKDAVPGRSHPLTVEADKPGEYIGQCTEFCGLSHAQMHIKVIALEPGEFDAWHEKQLAPVSVPTDKESDAYKGYELFAGTCTSCHRITDMEDPANPGTTFEYGTPKHPNDFSGAVNQVSGAAPNLTKFMTRTTFAGAMFQLRLDTDECKALGVNWADTEDGLATCLNRPALESWLRDAPSQKAMYAGDAMTPESRGMPNFNLSEDQIDQLVAFLITLK